ncbi:MAG: hypothetical protein IPG45_19965 [Deltaproteobacteria bacterium]|jgi:hypothetical protein|nr:hypothetical protein [Deltaproteobacteria bacterium]
MRLALLLALLLWANTAQAEQLFKLDGRAALGPAWRLEDTRRLRLGGELSITARIGLQPKSGNELIPVLLPELGAAAISGDAGSDYYFMGGVGAGLGNDWFVMGLVPSFLGGSFYDALGRQQIGYGGRLMGEIELIRIIGVQAAYNLYVYDRSPHHELRVTFSINAFPVIIILLSRGTL